MIAVRFVDTNVLLGAVSTAKEERRKAAAAREILEASDLGLSVQVLQEFYVQATRTGRKGHLSHEQAAALVESWLRFPVKEIDIDVLRAALTTSARFKISYRDAAIVAAARALDCAVLLSEDLNDGQDYGGVRVSNPFA